MGDRIVSPVAISSGMAAKAVKDLAAKEALCVLVEKKTCGGRCCKAVRGRSASESKGELAPPTSQAPALRTWYNSREIRSP